MGAEEVIVAEKIERPDQGQQHEEHARAKERCFAVHAKADDPEIGKKERYGSEDHRGLEIPGLGEKLSVSHRSTHR